MDLKDSTYIVIESITCNYYLKRLTTTLWRRTERPKFIITLMTQSEVVNFVNESKELGWPVERWSEQLKWKNR
jgi:hypothetical protein